MPAPVPNAVRRKIAQLVEKGRSAAWIAVRLDLSVRTVRHLVKRFREGGPTGLEPGYSNKPLNSFADSLREEFVALKREHPDWGAEYLRIVWERRHRGRAAPAARTVRRWTQAASVPRSATPRTPADRAREVHEIWQIDAADQMTLADGSGASWLRAADELSGAVLGTTVFPPQALVSRAASRRAGRTRKAL